MTYDEWTNIKSKKFEDDNNTIFEKGPFEVDGIKYDWKFTCENETDYCYTSELIAWNVRIKSVIE